MVAEDDYHDRVVSYFDDKMDDAEIKHETTLDATGREPDVIVNGDVYTYVIEIENDFESVIGGVGQVLLYANHAPPGEHWVPTVVIPESIDPDEPEWTMVKDIVNGLVV